MTTRSEITHMQVRIARQATEKWGLPIGEVGRLFKEYQVFENIRDFYEAYHLEGDEAVWEELQPFFRNKGCSYAEA